MVLGSAGVGKSDLITQYCYGFAEHGQYNPTIEDSYRKSVVIDNTSLILDIIDTAGMEEYGAMRELYIRKGNGFLIVYSVTNNSSFLEAAKWRDIILGVKEGSDKVPIVLVGNNKEGNSKDKKEREVSFQEGQDLAAKWGCPFYEITTPQQIEETFTVLVREMMLVGEGSGQGKQPRKSEMCNVI